MNTGQIQGARSLNLSPFTTADKNIWFSLVTCLSAYYWLLVGKSWIRKVLKDHGMEAIELQKLVDVSRSVFGCSWATVASKWHLNVAYY